MEPRFLPLQDQNQLRLASLSRRSVLVVPTALLFHQHRVVQTARHYHYLLVRTTALLFHQHRVVQTARHYHQYRNHRLQLHHKVLVILTRQFWVVHLLRYLHPEVHVRLTQLSLDVRQLRFHLHVTHVISIQQF